MLQSLLNHASWIVTAVIALVSGLGGWLYRQYTERGQDLHDTEREQLNTRLTDLETGVQGNRRELSDVKSRIRHAEKLDQSIKQQLDRIEANQQAHETDLDRLEESKVGRQEFQNVVQQQNRLLDQILSAVG